MATAVPVSPGRGGSRAAGVSAPRATRAAVTHAPIKTRPVQRSTQAAATRPAPAGAATATATATTAPTPPAMTSSATVEGSNSSSTTAITTLPATMASGAVTFRCRRPHVMGKPAREGPAGRTAQPVAGGGRSGHRDERKESDAGEREEPPEGGGADEERHEGWPPGAADGLPRRIDDLPEAFQQPGHRVGEEAADGGAGVAVIWVGISQEAAILVAVAWGSLQDRRARSSSTVGRSAAFLRIAAATRGASGPVTPDRFGSRWATR